MCCRHWKLVKGAKCHVSAKLDVVQYLDDTPSEDGSAWMYTYAQILEWIK